MKEIEAFKIEANEIIKNCEQRINEINQLLPFSQMTYEDAAYSEPQLTLDLENNPSFWPHEEEDYIFDKPQDSTEQIEETKKIDAGH